MLADRISLQNQPRLNERYHVHASFSSLSSRISSVEKKISFMPRESVDELLPTREQLSDFLTFQRYWFKLRTGIDFRISQPIGRQSHHLQLAELAPKIFNQEINRLMINIARRYGKTEFAVAIILYSFAYYPHSHWMYISIDKNLIAKAADLIAKVMGLREWQLIYGTRITKTKKDQTSVLLINSSGGQIYAVTAFGGIAGHGGCIQNYIGFSGGIVIDDIHKLSAVINKNHREKVAEIYGGSILNSLNDKHHGLIMFIGQISHEDCLPSRLRRGEHDVFPWHILKLQSLDVHDHALYPELESAEFLKEMRKKQPYFFSAQHQQEAIPAGGALFKEEFFVLHPPSILDKIIFTWINIDCAETDKNWNDATAMTFFGLYKIENKGMETGEYGIHVIDCAEEHVEAGDLEEFFDEFYANCCRFKIKPIIGIEKKSAGVTLLSVLKKRQGLTVVNTIPFRTHKDEDTSQTISNNLILDRSKREASKIDRFISCQYYWNSRYISATEMTKCAQRVKDHMIKITANDSHEHDDIADTIADAIHMVYVSGYIPSLIEQENTSHKSRPNLSVKKHSYGSASWRN